MTARLARIRPALLRLAAPALALLAGGLLPLALAPFHVWPLLAVSAGGLFLLLRRVTGSGTALLLGWLYGVGKYAVGGSWIYVSIHVYGAAPPALAAFLVALFVTGMALFPMAMAWMFSALRRRVDGAANPCTDAALFSGLWVLFEWLLTWVLTGFPWLFAGYAMLDTPLVSLAPVGGVLLVSLAAVFTTANLAVAVRSRLALVWAALPWLLAAALAGVSWTDRGESRTVALVQGNVPQELKWQPESRQMILGRYRDLTEQVADRDIVIWPEAAIPVYLHRASAYLDSVTKATAGDLVLGIPIARAADEAATLHNGAVSSGGGTYLKRRLVPFGEYVPLEGLLRGLIGFFDLPMSRSQPGEAQQPVLLAGGVSLAIAICYEIAYPDMVRRDAANAAALVTLSNDTWFGASIGPHQHMQIARMRAVETGRYLLRATNNGITAIVDERGDPVPARALLAGNTTNDVAALPQFQAGVLDGAFHVVHGQTPFTRFGHIWLFAMVALLAIAFVRARTRSSA
ncbi:MAG: apolipoprotein N-acyltransferase [Gammaproteobacteria bacterium]|nr:apolipoprotein N-acyltransferase [Gammaproteobacteria bacterium]MYB37610.1 apolipoprotein N-acyltransferase [Gammaproteobacteria bacterium]